MEAEKLNELVKTTKELFEKVKELRNIEEEKKGDVGIKPLVYDDSSIHYGIRYKDSSYRQEHTITITEQDAMDLRDLLNEILRERSSVWAE